MIMSLNVKKHQLQVSFDNLCFDYFQKIYQLKWAIVLIAAVDLTSCSKTNDNENGNVWKQLFDTPNDLNLIIHKIKI